MGSRCQRYPSPVTTPKDYICGEYKGGSTPPKATQKEASQGTAESKAGAAAPTTAKRRAKTKGTTSPPSGKDGRTTKADSGNKD